MLCGRVTCERSSLPVATPLRLRSCTPHKLHSRDIPSWPGTQSSIVLYILDETMLSNEQAQQLDIIINTWILTVMCMSALSSCQQSQVVTA
jgi:hypothetical protein